MSAYSNLSRLPKMDICIVTGTGTPGLKAAGFEIRDSHELHVKGYLSGNPKAKATFYEVQLGGSDGSKIWQLDRHSGHKTDQHNPAYKIDHIANMETAYDLGVKQLLTTSACGGCHPKRWPTGSIVLVRDSLTSTGETFHIEGKNDYQHSGDLFTRQMNDELIKIAMEEDITLQDNGIYYVDGTTLRSNFETPSEILNGPVLRTLWQNLYINFDRKWPERAGLGRNGNLIFPYVVGGLVGMNDGPEAHSWRKFASDNRGEPLDGYGYASIAIVTDQAMGLTDEKPNDEVHKNVAKEAMNKIGVLFAEYVNRYHYGKRK